MRDREILPESRVRWVVRAGVEAWAKPEDGKGRDRVRPSSVHPDFPVSPMVHTGT